VLTNITLHQCVNETISILNTPPPAPILGKKCRQAIFGSKLTLCDAGTLS